MIAQVVFDLPIDGVYDYLIPEHLISKVNFGMRVRVLFGPRPQVGFVVGLLEISTIAKLKPILSVTDSSTIFNELDLAFAREFSLYYGCSLGEALGTMLRGKTDLRPSTHWDKTPQLSLYRCLPKNYVTKIQVIIKHYSDIRKDSESRFLILVPDTFRAQAFTQEFHETSNIKIGMRSSVFESDGHFDCVIMVDEEDSSFKQEQTPMYETRQVLLTRSKIFGFDIAFVGVAPSVELIALVRDNKVQLIEDKDNILPLARLVDLGHYKYIPGLLSPPVKDAVDAALKSGKKTILILNRKGSYRLTRCVECAEILKCNHCDSPLIYSRSAGQFQCRHCTFIAPGDTVCPKCHKPSWRSQGIGVEQLQTELKKYFPLARIHSFERDSKVEKKSLSDFDILISTNAVLRFQGQWQSAIVAFIDFDAELNRLDMRSAFNAYGLALHISSMATETVFMQTRNIKHYVLGHLARGNWDNYYDEELQLRKEFGFSPFKHWIKISWRGKLEKITYQAANQAFNALNQITAQDITVTPPLADMVGRKRDQFRFNVMAQSSHVIPAVAFIKISLQKLKRPSRVILTLNIDP